MVKVRGSWLAAILLAALPLTAAQFNAKRYLNEVVVKEMGAESLRTLQITGSGSSYDEKGQHSDLPSYNRRLDLSENVAASPWNTQVSFWLTPYGFLKGAMANNSTVEIKPALGEQYRVVTFTLPGNHKIVGYMNGKNLVERVQAWVDNDVMLEAVYRDYTDIGGVKVPSIMIQNRAGTLSQIVIVTEAKPNG